ncbi:GPP34 family phosphoprotein [Georgenia sp. EYE_87]|uniref:GOLPH3/VPS74 family protein n=1 Tax=Georgenia sp. EYE_87 TaxID=2853448 RepID=UPI00200436AB|nr:GPP34 family phosphoprotein [Georgenia sp. EYE_87]MCK6211720.1 GPP34 family phosphoprotein [Georgenia sp. EYE_87]
MLIAEDVVLLLTDDTTGRPVVDSTRRDLVLAGAVVLELAERGRLQLSGPGQEVRAGRVVVADTSPTGDDVLDTALGNLAARKPDKPKNALPAVAKGLHRRLLERLAERGILRVEEDRVLGIFPRTSWPALDSAHEDELRRGLHDVLVVGRTPTVREANLISLLQSVNQVPKVLPGAQIGRAELRRRAGAVEGSFASDAVRKAVDEAIAVMTATTTTVSGA